jgi:hypothetical protein
MTGVARSPAQGGLEGLQPFKRLPFLMVVAGSACNHHQKLKICRGVASPNSSTA